MLRHLTVRQGLSSGLTARSHRLLTTWGAYVGDGERADVWIAPAPAPEDTHKGDGEVSLRVGFTEAAFEEIGDVVRVRAATEKEKLPPHGRLVELHWEGYKRSSSDELYHARWESAEGTASLQLPFAATVTATNAEALAENGARVDEQWLVQVRCARDVLSAFPTLSEREYAAVVRARDEW